MNFIKTIRKNHSIIHQPIDLIVYPILLFLAIDPYLVKLNNFVVLILSNDNGMNNDNQERSGKEGKERKNTGFRNIVHFSDFKKKGKLNEDE